jgi:hypothetical protein
MDPLTLAHREAQLAIRSQVLRALVRIWPAMDWTRLDATFPAWVESVRPLVLAGHSTSADIAASYLRRYRAASGVRGEAVIVKASPLDEARLLAVMEITAKATAKAAAVRGVTAEQAMANAFVRSSGAATRLVLEGGRQTLVESIKADRRCTGYERVLGSNPCDFCRKLEGWSKSAPATGQVNQALFGNFEAHDHCGCSVRPTYS